MPAQVTIPGMKRPGDGGDPWRSYRPLRSVFVEAVRSRIPVNGI